MGKIIAFSGVDGSGKTTAAKLLVKRLRSYGVKAIYRHEFDYFLLGWIKEVIIKSIGDQKRNSLSDYIDVHLEKGTPLQKIIYFLGWIDHFVSQLYFRLKKGVIVHDRWHYDHIAHIEYKPRKNAFLKKLYSISPRADVIILLDVSPQVSYQRRKNDSNHPRWARDLRHYEAQTSLMLNIAKAFNYDKLVNSSKPPHEVVSDVICFLKEFQPEIMRRTD